MSRLRRLFLIGTALVLATLGTAPAALGAGRVTAVSGDGGHCVARLERIAPGRPDARIARLTCFSTFAQSIAFTTRGRVRLPASATPNDLTRNDLTREAVQEAATASSVVIGINYQQRDYDDFYGSVVWEATGGCTSSRSWAVSYVGDTWNDKFSSSKAYSNCNKFHHYEHRDYNRDRIGATVTCRPNCPYVGDAMNDRTSSLSWDY